MENQNSKTRTIILRTLNFVSAGSLAFFSIYGALSLQSPYTVNKFGERMHELINPYVVGQQAGVYPFVNSKEGHIKIDATFTNPANHKSITVPCILDTGAPSSYVSKRIYNQLGLDVHPNKNKTVEIGKVCGTESRIMVDNLDVDFHGNTVKNIPTLIDIKEEKEKVLGEEDNSGLCLIGRTYLDNFVYTIDSHKRTITFH